MIKIHVNVNIESEYDFSDDYEVAVIGENDSEVDEESLEEELAKLSNLELAWKVLEVARLGYIKAGNKEAMAEILTGCLGCQRKEPGLWAFSYLRPGLKCLPNRLKTTNCDNTDL